MDLEVQIYFSVLRLALILELPWQQSASCWSSFLRRYQEVSQFSAMKMENLIPEKINRFLFEQSETLGTREASGEPSSFTSIQRRTEMSVLDAQWWVCVLGKTMGEGFSLTTSNVVMPKLCQNQIENGKKHLENCSNLKHNILVQVQGDSRGVVIFINSYNIEFQQKKKEQIALCSWHDNLPFTFCIFIYQFEKQRTKTINNRCSIQSVWYMNSVSMQIVIPGLFMRTAGKAGSLLCKNRQKGYD